MNRLLLTAGLILWGTGSLAQNAPVNLVPNGGFEEHSDCPWGGGLFGMIDYWTGLHGSSDFFHRCGEPAYSIPGNYGGYQEPYYNADSAYVGVATYTTAFNGGQESFYAELTEPLVAGEKYRVKLMVSLSEYWNYATCCMGVIFGSTPPPFPPVTSNLSDVELVLDANNIDTEVWYEMDEVYTALGGESEMYIGNFRPDADSQPVYVGENTPEGDVAYFFIDNVSVKLETLTTVEEEQHIGPINISNPVHGQMAIYHKRPVQLQLLDMSGRVVLSDRLIGSTSMVDVSHLNKGIYLAVFTNEKGERHAEKVVIQR